MHNFQNSAFREGVGKIVKDHISLGPNQRVHLERVYMVGAIMESANYRVCRGKLEALDWFLRRFLRRFLNDCYKLILYFTHSDQCPVLGVSLNEDNLDL
ncbi:uncharacterized protein OCT59_001535 [Rhizophagus irregularis]|uniref:uncharacterized protein n=1 Tax=Rhizophagus irregularis TaxID=588596 RepID=UPI00332E08EE|nr:hypothetical protein OCT59_001535 [Rhizophagus irregularis]